MSVFLRLLQKQVPRTFFRIYKIHFMSKFILLSFLLAATCQNNAPQSGSDFTDLHQCWKKSWGEGQGTESVYRPCSYEVQASRGIDGFTFSADGKMVRNTFGPADAPLHIDGTWTVKDSVLIMKTLDGTYEPFPMKIKELRKDKLVLEVVD